MDSKNAPAAGQYFMLQPDARRGGAGHGVVFENRKELLTPPRRILRPDAGGFPELAQTPRLVYSPKQGALPQDLEGGFSGYWLVSERLRNVMMAVDASAFEFVEADYRLADGSVGERRFLCDFVRELDALDEEASTLEIERSDEFVGGKYYNLLGNIQLSFRKEVLGDAHVFRLPFSGLVFCDARFKSAVERAGIIDGALSNGLWFEDLVNF
ncbi:DUF1629 domain-containing protein [Stenotrophomonas oahuensis]|uniref:DUF1629 domain-containing protein n=1 Tax=Stenotrophomonas oahuensis TaxID=3003271 RepID=A0ABY9YPV2_9GAMM|nr:DUF1629 domain-containing protein [Stenotrophomonas sp. A5586]WNH52743.1 DUF1629 domain-containing protein [Stenotrophomonas sp. A5586]